MALQAISNGSSKSFTNDKRVVGHLETVAPKVAKHRLEWLELGQDA